MVKNTTRKQGQGKDVGCLIFETIVLLLLVFLVVCVTFNVFGEDASFKITMWTLAIAGVLPIIGAIFGIWLSHK